MSLDFYDRNGRPYAYSDDGEHIYTFGGKPIGYIDGGSIYRFDGQHVGYFNSGILRDEQGAALLFTDGASGGPMKPMKRSQPVKGMKKMKPVKSPQASKPLRPLKSISWSSYEPEALFES
jgi:hypothetical protein